MSNLIMLSVLVVLLVAIMVACQFLSLKSWPLFMGILAMIPPFYLATGAVIPYLEHGYLMISGIILVLGILVIFRLLMWFGFIDEEEVRTRRRPGG